MSEADPFFVVTSTGKGCDPRPCIMSVAKQTYPYFRHRYIAADPQVYGKAMLEVYKSAAHALFITYSSKTVIENVWEYWQTLRDSDVIVWLDGDDWLSHPHVLECLANIYRSKDPWLTYGSFRFSRDPGFTVPQMGTRYPTGVSPRADVWRASHLKTFRAGLVKRVDPATFLNERGVIADYCTDRTFMLPMLEMAGERYEAVSEMLSVYNLEASFLRSRDPEQTAAEEAERVRIHSLPAYERLDERPW